MIKEMIVLLRYRSELDDDGRCSNWSRFFFILRKVARRRSTNLSSSPNGSYALRDCGTQELLDPRGIKSINTPYLDWSATEE